MTTNKQFQADLKHKAKVTREDIVDDRGSQASVHLTDIAKLLAPRDGLTYLGSASIHIYKSDIANELYFASQVGSLGACPEGIAQAAFKDLAGSAMEHYNKKRPVTRSGF